VFGILKCTLYILSFGAVVHATYASAEYSVQLLAKECEGLEPDRSRPIIGQASCLAYIAGSLDQIILTDGFAVRGGAKPTICAPSNVVKLEQLRDLIIKFAKEKPESHHESARAVLRGLIQGVYRCRPA
jgi:hypothetical protein